MGLRSWVRRHRVLGAFAAGALLTLVVLAAAGYWVLSDQRRSARALAAALTQAFAREVRIERVTDLGTDRVVMRGVTLPREAGWPATVAAERVEATGPLLAAARGDAAPVRLTITRATVDLPAGGGGGLAAALAGLGEAVHGFLANPLLVEVSLTGGRAMSGGVGTEFDLTLLKGRGDAKGTLTLRPPSGAPLTLALDGRLNGTAARLGLEARGALAPLAGWVPDAMVAALGDRAVELHLEADLGTAGAVAARGRLAFGDLVDAHVTAALESGVLELAVSQGHADLAFVAALAGLGWRPTGRVELSDVTATWPGAGAGPTVRGVLRVPTLTVPAIAAGTDVAAERVETRLALEPAGSALTLTGELRAARLRAAGLETAPAETRYRLSFDSRGNLARAQLDGLQVRVEGAALRGGATYDAAARRLDARLEGDDVEAGELVRRLLPGWLAPGDRLRLAGLRVTTAGLDPRDLGQGVAGLEARSLRLVRSEGQLTGGHLTARADLAGGPIAVAVDAERLSSTLPVLPGAIGRVTASVGLARQPDSGFRLARAALTARDGEGREMLVATLTPAATHGLLRLSARAPALERLDGLWPDVPRRLNGSARLDVELGGGTPAAADGRLALSVPEGDLWGGKVSVREVEAEVPIRRGMESAGEPPWGKLAIGELIGYGVVVRDLTTPARLWRDRLSLNQLAYVLYSGSGTGWSEVEWQPAGLVARGKLTGSRVRIEEFMAAYGIRGGTMTGLLGYELDYQYRVGQLGLNGRFEVPEGGMVNIELLNRVLGYAETDPSGVVRQALENLRAFDYKHAAAEVRSAAGDIRISLSLQGRERFLVFPPKVREINIRNMPLSFLARQFPGS